MRYKKGIIFVNGPPAAGKSTVVNAVVEASKELMTVIRTGDIVRAISTPEDFEHMRNGYLYPKEDILRALILEKIEYMWNHGAELIILDGFPRSVDQLDWALNHGLVGTELHGCVINITASDLVSRAKLRMRDEQDAEFFIKKKIDVQVAENYKMELRMNQVGIPYYMIVNDDLGYAVKQFAKLLGLRK